MVVAGGSFAIASVGKNSVKSNSVKNNTLKSVDLKNGKGVQGKDVKDESLTGDDVEGNALGGDQISESSLSQVPEALNSTLLDNSGPESLTKVAQGSDSTCDLTSTTVYTNCTAATITLDRTSGVTVILTGQWYSNSGDGTEVRGECRVERDTTNISGSRQFGTKDDDTDGNQTRFVAISDREASVSPGTYDYRIQCREPLGEITMEDVVTHVIATGTG